MQIQVQMTDTPAQPITVDCKCVQTESGGGNQQASAIRANYTAADSIPYKLISNAKLVGIITQRKVIPPYHVQFIPTNKCNLNCSFCSCSEEDRSKEMGISEAEYIISLLSELGTRAVTITGGGEPLMYKQLPRLLWGFALHNIQVGMVTNGLLLHQNNSALKPVSWCRISNGDDREFTPDYHRRLHEVVCANPHIDWAFSHVVSCYPNLKEIEKVIQFANEHEFTHVRLVADLLDFANVDMECLKYQLEDMGIDLSRVIFQARNEPTKGGPCYICYLKPVITADCKVMACCLDQNELVLINRDGNVFYEYIKDVKIGDIAEGYGRIRNVFKKVGEEILEVVLQNNRTVRVSKDHTMMVCDNYEYAHKVKKLVSKYTLHEKTASELSIGDLIPVKYLFDAQKHQDQINEHEAEFLGYYVAEGCSNEKTALNRKGHQDRSTRIGFMFGKQEHEYRERFEYLCQQLGFNYSKTERRTGIQYGMGQHKQYDTLVKHCGGTSCTKRIPWFIQSASDDIKWAFIKGYFYGDGCMHKPSKHYDGHKVSMCTVSRTLASDLVYLFATLGIVASLHVDRRAGTSYIEGRKVTVKDRYVVLIGGAYNLQKIPFLDIKQTKQRSPRRATGFLRNEHDGVMLVPVKEIRIVQSESLVDIQVESTNLFTSSFGIIVHNCGSQYSLKEPSKKMPRELCLGSAFDLEKIIMRSHRPFNGSICYRCYYKSYNDVLGAMIGEFEHEAWV